jgi:hypothetical protein
MVNTPITARKTSYVVTCLLLNIAQGPPINPILSVLAGPGVESASD